MFRGRGGFAGGSSTTTSSSSSSSVRAKPAKCEANQEVLDKLTQIAAKASSNPNSNYVFTLKRAMKSLAECTQPIATYKQALTLKHVGPKLAQLICPSDQGKDSGGGGGHGGGHGNDKATTTTTATKRKTTKATAAASKSSKTSSSSSSTTTTTTNTTTTTKQEVGPSAKQKTYDKALHHSTNLVLPSGNWKVVLLVDGREQKSQQIVARCQQCGIPSEERHLPIGDMAWIARHMPTNLEVMLGTILERKDTADLASSLFGTRYLEQRLRLQHCGLPQVLFLVEGDMHKCNNCPADTLLMCMMETRVQLGFQIVQTKHLEDSIRLLKGLHRRLVKRSFPQAFSKTLPDFGSPQLCPKNRKRRRPTSLLELLFDTPPVPPFGTTRLITYNELKAKVERDREAGTRTSGAVYMAMLKQVPTWSQKKCHALAAPQHYPTMHSLLTGFQKSSDPSRMVQDLVLCEQGRKIGPKSATELHVAFGTDGNGTLRTTTAAATTTAATTSNSVNSSNSSCPATATAAVAVARLPMTTAMTTTTTIPQAPLFHDIISATVTNSAPSSPESSIQQPKQKPAAKRTAPSKTSAVLSFSETSAPQKPAPAPAAPPLSLSQSSSSCVDLTEDTPQPNRTSAAAAVSQPFASMAESILINRNASEDTWQSPKATIMASSSSTNRKPPPSPTSSTSSEQGIYRPPESSLVAGPSSPVPPHDSCMCVDLTQDTPQKKPPPAAVKPSKPSLPFLLEQEQESPLFPPPIPTRKPALTSYSSASSSDSDIGMSPSSPADNSFSFSSPPGALATRPTAARILHSAASFSNHSSDGSLDRSSRVAPHATTALKRLEQPTKHPSPSSSESCWEGFSPSILVVDSSEDEATPPPKTGIMASMPQRFVSNDSSQPSFPSAKLQLDSSDEDDADDLLDESSKKRAKPSEVIEID
jgi:ERCC4-type nuclease